MNHIPAPKRCVIYARYNTDNQNPLSPEAQIAVCERRANAEGWRVVEVFNDEALSGIATGNRSEYNRMYELATAKGFDILLVNDLSRLARSTDLDGIVRRFRFRRVRVVGVQDSFDSDSPTAGLQAGMSGITSQQTIEMISKRTHSAQDNIVAKGGQAGGRAYGYKVVHDLHPTAKDKSGRPIIVAKRLEIDPVEAKVVKMIFTMFVDQGLSTLTIAAHLNAQGIPSPGSTWERKERRKGSWMSSTLSSDPKRGCGILHNELYRGWYVWNRTKGVKDPDTGKMEYWPRPHEEWRRERRPNSRIIDDDLWNRAQAVHEARRSNRGAAISKGIASAKRIGGADSRYLLGSILRCGECGARMIGDSRTDYICPSYASGGCTNDLRVRRDEVHQAVFTPLERHLLSDEAVERGRAEVEAALRRLAKEEDKAARKTTQTKEMKHLDEQETALRALALSPAALSAALAAIERERQEILQRATRNSVPQLSRARALIAKMPEIVARYRELIEQGAKALTDLRAVSTAREAMRRLLVDGTIVLKPNASHTSMVGAVRFVDLGDHVLGLAGTKRQVKCLKDLERKVQENQTQATVVAGAGFVTFRETFSVSQSVRVK